MFFFFKRKTAYEMRISDWSSDVCSSDLFFSLPLAASFAQAAPPAASQQTSDHPKPATIKRRGMLYLVRDLQHGHTAYLFGTVHVGQTAFYQIGRASCRERVGTSV